MNIKSLFGILASLLLLSTAVSAFYLPFAQTPYNFKLKSDLRTTILALPTVSLNTANIYVSDNTFDWFELRGTVSGMANNDQVLVQCTDGQNRIFNEVAHVVGNTFEYNQAHLTRYSVRAFCTAKIVRNNNSIASTNLIAARVILPQ